MLAESTRTLRSNLIRLAVNLSVSTLTDRELPAVVDQSIKTWGVPAESVVLEIAENTLIVEAERSVAILTRLKGVGVQLSIDDFGSGFSSLGHLRRFPFDELKVDRPFVGGMLARKEDFAVVKSAIDIAHNFGWRAVAEGADPVPVRDALRELGCDLAQGHSVSPAVAGPAFREWWTNQPQGT